MKQSDPPLARCVIPGCAWRFRHGQDRLCPDHSTQEQLLDRVQQMAGIIEEHVGLTSRLYVRNGGE